MSLTKSWCSPEEAESKYGVDKVLILKWVEDGLIRCEQRDGKVVRVNMDDLELKVDELVRM